MIELDIRTPDLAIFADASRLQQVFWNLLSNAVKFTPPEGTLRVIVDRPDTETASVAVSDTGAGIPPQLLPVIFDRFRQGAGAIHRGGLGLGLAIAKEVVELHGGTIRAESEGENRGSLFTVTLPLVS
jgi:signal transduction histidine kinase